MCGISGVVNCGSADVVARMNSVQAHRGPNDSGIWEHRSPDHTYVALGNRRLSILDLTTSGHMPMSNEDGSLRITYNGEIYNFRELRQELRAKGHEFKSETDTEVVLHLYEEYGSECVRRLRGMFAFAICDLRPNSPELFLARDHFGIKPLYYFRQAQRMAFASEAKALFQVPGISADIDLESLYQYLTFLWVPEPETLFRGIQKLPAGHFALFRNGELKVTQYWDLNFPAIGTEFPRSEEELADEIRERFQQSVKSQMVSDVPIGAFLSAGLDSSSIVAMMRQSTDQTVRTYTVTFPPEYRIGENALDDPRVPAEFARQIGCENYRITVQPDVVDLLPKLIWHMDEPTADPAIITAYLVCQEAKQHATVMLSGIGGDEVFAGYRKHTAHYWAQLYQKIPASIRERIRSSLMDAPSMRGSSLKGSLRLAKKMVRSASLPPVERFIMNCTYMNREQKNALFTQSVYKELRNFDPAINHRAAFEHVGEADFLNQMLYLDSKIFMPSLNLNYNDKMSMASSVEVRVPFLDPDLAEFVAWNVPPHLKIKGLLRPNTKYILRKAMQNVLPRKILKQPKAGFAAPVDYWLASDLREMVDDVLSESRIRARGLFQPEVVRKYVHEHREGKQDWSMQIWQLLTLELWMQTFLDCKTSPSTSQAFARQEASA
ncbi:MAG TPA: asparagine synthase (glutamine-hydrolyzing) [Terriglobales bacterium]